MNNPHEIKNAATPPHQAALGIQAFTLLCIIRLSLTFLPFKTTRSLINLLKSRPSLIDASFTLYQLTWAVRRAARFVPGATCLTQALALHTLARFYHHSVTLRIGVSPSSRQPFRAHAWVESENEILLGNLPELHTFTPLPSPFTSPLPNATNYPNI